MKHLMYGIRYLANYWLRGQCNPLICGLVLHNICNLRCRHCAVINRPALQISFKEACEVIEAFYAEGGRCLYLEGGEPLLWKDGEYETEDLVRFAKRKGYYAIIIYTNGTIEIKSLADTVFVSVDGLEETHDKLRGKSFGKIMDNISNSPHQSLYINYTINSENKSDIEAFCAYIDTIPQIKGTFFYFHTPYYGYDELNLSSQNKKEILLQLLNLKKQYRILNSTAGLKSAFRNDWKKKLEICKVYEGGTYYSCCRDNKNGEVCAECGYLSYAEIEQTLKLNPGAMVNALKYF